MPLTFEPDHFEINPQTGLAEVIPSKSNHYIYLGAHGRPDIFYVWRENKYYKKNKTEYSDEEIEAFGDDLVWDYSDDLGPPTREAIEAKREELIRETFNDEDFDKDAILLKTCPRELRLKKDFRKLLNETPPDQRTAARLNASVK